MVQATDAFRLHKFIPVKKSPTKNSSKEQLSPCKPKDPFTPTKTEPRGVGSQLAPVYDERYSVSIAGIIEYLRFFQNRQRDPRHSTLFVLAQIQKRRIGRATTRVRVV